MDQQTSRKSTSMSSDQQFSNFPAPVESKPSSNGDPDRVVTITQLKGIVRQELTSTRVRMEHISKNHDTLRHAVITSNEATALLANYIFLLSDVVLINANPEQKENIKQAELNFNKKINSNIDFLQTSTIFNHNVIVKGEPLPETKILNEMQQKQILEDNAPIQPQASSLLSHQKIVQVESEPKRKISNQAQIEQIPQNDPPMPSYAQTNHHGTYLQAKNIQFEDEPSRD